MDREKIERIIRTARATASRFYMLKTMGDPLTCYMLRKHANLSFENIAAEIDAPSRWHALKAFNMLSVPLCSGDRRTVEMVNRAQADLEF